MSSTKTNLLLAGICILSLIFSGGFVTALSPVAAPVFSVDAEAGQPIGPPLKIQNPPPTFDVPSRPTGDGSSGGTTPSSESGDGADPVTPTAASATPTPTDTAGPTTPERTPTATATQTPDESGVGGLAPPLRWSGAAVLVGLLALLAGGATVAWYSGGLGSSRTRSRLATIAADRVVILLVTVVASVAGSLERSRARLESAGAAVLRTTGAVRRSGTSTTASPGVVSYLVGTLQRLLATLRGVLDSLRTSVPEQQPRDPGRRDADHPIDRGAGTRAPASESPAEAFDIELAWGWLAAQTDTASAGARTPEEIAREAIDAGYPAEPVQTLLEAFRDVTYGKHPPTRERREAVRRAYERLQMTQHTRGDSP